MNMNKIFFMNHSFPCSSIILYLCAMLLIHILYLKLHVSEGIKLQIVQTIFICTCHNYNISVSDPIANKVKVISSDTTHNTNDKSIYPPGRKFPMEFKFVISLLSNSLNLKSAYD